MMKAMVTNELWSLLSTAVCEIGLTEEFAEVSANACISQAMEGMHFQPYIKRKLNA